MKRIILLLFISVFSLVMHGSALASDVEIHGFLAQGFMQSDENNFLADTETGSFEFSEMGINFTTNVTTNLRLGMQFFSRDLGEVGNDEVVVDWVFGDYNWKEWLGIRIGKLKVPLGLYNETRDVDSLRTSILLPQSVYDEKFRDAGQGLKGISAYGNLSLGAAGLMQYEFQISEVSIPLDSGTGALVAASPLFDSLLGIEPIRVYLGAFKWFTPIDGLLFHVSSFVSKNVYNVTSSAALLPLPVGTPLEFKSDLQYTYLSAEYVWEDLTLATEWLLDSSTRNITGILVDDEVKATSYYISVSYRFTDWLEVGTYYSENIADNDADGAANELNDIALSFRFDVNEYWTIKLEGHSMDGFNGVDANENGTSEEDWSLFLAKVSYSF